MDWVRTSAGCEEKAFWALLATIFSIAFSIAAGQLGAGVCLLLVVVGLARGRIPLRWPTVMLPAVLFILLALTLSAYAGGGGGLWRRCGKLFWFLLIPVTATLVTGAGRERRAVVAFFAGCTVLAIKDLVLFPFLAWRKPVPDFLTALIDKGSMTDGQMLMLGVVGTSLLFVVLRKEGQRIPWWGWMGLALEVGGLLINFKRGSWFCALILLGVALLPRVRRRTWVLGVVVLIGLCFLPPIQARLAQLKREFNVEGGGRLTMWCKIAPALIRNHPAGIGYGCLTHDHMQAIDRRVEPNRNHLHANWAQVLVETGWAGLALYLVWMGVAIRDAVRHRGRLAIVVMLLLAGLLLNGLVEYNFGDTEMMFIYAFVMGVAASGQFADRLGCAPDQER